MLVVKAVTISNQRKGMKEYFDYVLKSSEIMIVPRSNEEDAVGNIFYSGIQFLNKNSPSFIYKK